MRHGVIKAEYVVITSLQSEFDGECYDLFIVKVTTNLSCLYSDMYTQSKYHIQMRYLQRNG